jgi:hypothetical protein
MAWINNVLYKNSMLIDLDRLRYIVEQTCTAKGYRLEGREVGVRAPERARIFFTPRRPDHFWNPTSLVSNGYRGLVLRSYRGTGCEADYSPPTRVMVKYTLIYMSTALHTLMA